MIHPTVRNYFDNLCCPCVRDDNSMNDDGSFICYPTRVGASILFYGRRKSYFPFHCSVGPDWLMVVVVFALIIVINGVILYVVSPLGWPPVLIGGVGALFLLCAYCSVAFTDPGTVFKNDYAYLINEHHAEVEDPMHTTTNLPTLVPTEEGKTQPVIFVNSVRTMECGHCQFRRPMSARHCTYCKTCIDHLDHHCPWCGRCIGEKNIKAFYIFVNFICVQFYFLLATLIYYLLFAFSDTDMPSGPHFRH